MKLPAARKILLCLRYGIGDVVMELPAIAALRQAAPAAHITALGAEPAIELLAGDGRIDRLLSVHDWGFVDWGDAGSAAGRQGVRRWLREEAFDLVLDPTHAVRGVGEAIWECCPQILDTGTELQNAALAQTTCGMAAVRRAIGDGWGIDIPAEAHPDLALTSAEKKFAADFLLAQGVIGSPVGISAVASSPLKRWSADGFTALARRLTEAGFDLLLFTGPGSLPLAAGEGNHRYGHFISVPPLHLRRTAALLAACRLFIGNDTGLMHLAAAAGTHLVALFGPTSPGIYLPDQVPALPLGGRTPCRYRRTASFGPPPCVAEGRCLEGGSGCIDRIEIEDVWQAVSDRLGAPPAATVAENRPWRH